MVSETTGLDPCPNPLRSVRIGRLYLACQVASDYWATARDGFLTRIWLSVALVEHRGNKALRVIVHRLALWVAWL